MALLSQPSLAVDFKRSLERQMGRLMNSSHNVNGTTRQKIKSGIPGVDDILMGGLPQPALYLLEGDPGSGKTTFGFQFVLEGARQGENALYVSLSESISDLQNSAQSHGWSLDQIILHELFSPADLPQDPQEHTFFPAAEIEATQIFKGFEELMARVQPKRLVIDSLSDLRLIVKNPLLLRRQIMAIKRLASQWQCTTLLLDDVVSRKPSQGEYGMDLLSVVHGVFQLKYQVTDCGTAHRSLCVVKMRGSDFHGGFNETIIARGGLRVFPRGVFHYDRNLPEFKDRIKTGVAELDQMLGGGFDRGTSNIIMGQAGVGKSTLSCLFAHHDLKSGYQAAIFLFDETKRSYLKRAKALAMRMEEYLSLGKLTLRKIESSALSPGEMIDAIRHEVEKNQAKLIVIDSLDGYFNTMPSEKHLLNHMHDLLAYLNAKNVTTILCSSQHGFIGQSLTEPQPFPVSYLTDNLIFLRFFEAGGRMRRAIAVVKHRCGTHDHYIHDMAIVDGVGLQVGGPLAKFQGILTGTPTYLGPIEELIKVESE